MIALLPDGQPDWPAIAAALAEPFEARYIDFKPSKTYPDKQDQLKGQSQAMAYLDSRAMQERLNTVVGVANWVFHWEPIITGAAPPTPGEHLLVVRGTLTIYGVPKQEVGTASNSDPDKGAVSDTLKRCFVMWGGAHDLYDLPAFYMNMERSGTTDKDKWRMVRGEQDRLRKKLEEHRRGQGTAPPQAAPPLHDPQPRPEPPRRQPTASAPSDSPLTPRLLAALAACGTTMDDLNASRSREQRQAWNDLTPSQQEQLVEYYEKKARMKQQPA